VPIKKQEFYEGAALHLLARQGCIQSLRYEPPLFVVNDQISILLKYSTKGRSPWGFTFTRDEQALLESLKSKPTVQKVVIGMVCGADGVASISYDAYKSVANRRDTAIHISCYRQHGEHYEVNGPDGTLHWKVAPSNWLKILER
jgi:hypothetical protein